MRAYLSSAVGLVCLACGASPQPSQHDGSGGSAGSNGGSATTGGSSTNQAGGSGGSAASTSSGGTKTTTGGTNGGTTSGGSAGDGGSGGLPHFVGNCDDLGAVDAFDDITPPDVDSEYGVVTVVADPVHSGTIFVGTDHHGILKSTNCGADWVKINTGTNSEALDGGILYTVELDPVNPDIIYASALYSSNSSLFRSTNGGVDFESLFPEGSLVAEHVEYSFFQSLSIDPENHEHLVVTFHSNCTGEYAPSCLGETTDSGDTWRLFDSPLDGWSEAAGPLVLGPTTWLLATGQNGVYFTSDSGETWDNVASGAYAPSHGYRSSDGYLYVGSDYGMYRTEDGSEWESIPNTFQSRAIIGDGTRMFANKTGDTQPYYTAQESDGLTWTAFASPENGSAAEHFAYDPDHSVLYASHRDMGLWRVVTK
jgi:hypothetical protein